MSKPSFSNIDLWLFELAEGNLSENQEEQLRLFLLQHPDLDVDKDAWEWAHVDKETFIYPDQDLLIKKSPSRKIGVYSSIALLLVLFVGCYEIFVQHGAEGASIAKNQVNRSLQTAEWHSMSFDGQLQGRKNNASLGNVSQLDIPYSFSLGNENITGVSIVNHNFLNTISVGDLTKNSDNKLLSGSQVGANWFRLEPNDVREVLKDYSRAGSADRSVNYFGNASSGKAHQLSFSQKLKRTARKIQRMMDNPIALNNFRDPHYHVPGMIHNDVNFSSSGTLLRTRIQTMSRLQWLGQPNQQLINTIAVDGYSYGIRGGWGVQLKNGYYKDGGLNISEASFTYSPKFSVNSWISVEPSVRFKMGYKQLNHEAMNGVEEVEVDRGNAIAYYPNGGTPIGKSIWQKDLGAGLMVNTKWFFVGVQADNLFKHLDNIYSNSIENPRRAGTEFFVTTGTDLLDRTKKMQLSPYVVYHRNEQLEEMWLGMNYQWNWFTVGAALSNSLEPAASIGMKFEHFALMYNTDYSLSAMTGDRALSHQVSLRFQTKPTRFGRNLMNSKL